MRHLIDLDRYPLDQPGAPACGRLVADAKADLGRNGMFNLDGFLCPGVAERLAAELTPTLDVRSLAHQRQHNVYFRKAVEGVAPDHPALKLMETFSHTICADHVPSLRA